MKANKYFLGAFGVAATMGTVIAICAGIVGLVGGGLLTGAVLGISCGVATSIGVLGVATAIFPVVKLCSYIDEKTNFFTRAGEIINTPFEKFGNWITKKFSSNTIQPSSNSLNRGGNSEIELTPQYNIGNTQPSAPEYRRLTIGSESPPPYSALPEHKKRNINFERMPSH